VAGRGGVSDIVKAMPNLDYSTTGRRSYRKPALISAVAIVVLYLGVWMYLASTGYRVAYFNAGQYCRFPNARFDQPVIHAIFYPLYAIDMQIRPNYWQRSITPDDVAWDFGVDGPASFIQAHNETQE